MMLVFVPPCVTTQRGDAKCCSELQRGESNLRIPPLLSWDAFAYFMDGL